MNKLPCHVPADKLASELQRQLQDQADWLRPDGLLDGIRNRLAWQPYHALPELKQTLGKVQSDRSDLSAVLLQFLLMRLIADFSSEKLSFNITDEIAELYQHSFARILGQPMPEKADDSYFKDLALASGALFPAGERVVEPFSVLQRSLMVNAGVRQSLQFIKSGLLAGGYKPVFRLHVHLAEQNRLSEQSWWRTCQRLAQMLEINPGIRGIVGSSWYYDPQVPAISLIWRLLINCWPRMVLTGFSPILRAATAGPLPLPKPAGRHSMVAGICPEIMWCSGPGAGY